ncbi:MAG: TetR/AcrR family transcriptional regulator [Thermodesulforhabdaceae bacterium]
MPENSSTKKELFRVAAKLFKEKGYRATSMQDIASQLGIQKPSIYYYISSKEDLLKEIAQVTMKMLIDAIERIVFSDMSPREKIEKIIESHVKLICENLDLFTVSLREINPINAESFWPDVVALRDRYENYVRNIIRIGKESGVLKKDIDEKLAGFALLGTLNWTIRWYSPQGDKRPEEIAEAWKKIFMEGFLA